MIIDNCNYCKKVFRKREQKYKFCSLICSNNFNRNGLKKIVLPEYNTRLAEFVGICLGDGYVSTYQTSITLNSNTDKEYIPYVVKLSNSLFPGIKISLIKKTSENAIDIRINSVIVADFFRNMGIVPKNKKIPDWIRTSFDFKKSCVRGLFDTEGSISSKTYESKTKGKRIYYQLNFRNYDRSLIRFVRDVLLELQLKPTMTLTKSLYLSNPKDINIFEQSIGFGNPKLSFNKTLSRPKTTIKSAT